MHAQSGSPAHLCCRGSHSSLCVVTCSLLRGLIVCSCWSDNILVSKLKACSSDELDPEIQIMSSTSRQRFGNSSLKIVLH